MSNHQVHESTVTAIKHGVAVDTLPKNQKQNVCSNVQVKAARKSLSLSIFYPSLNFKHPIWKLPLFGGGGTFYLVLFFGNKQPNKQHINIL